MRDCVFLVADSQMEAMIAGFLTRDRFHMSLGCGAFEFDPRHDLIVHPQRDPGVYTRGVDLLGPFLASHRRAVVMLDAAWDGCPGREAVHAKISDDLAGTWNESLVVVLEPELEAWLWQDNVHVAQALGVGDFTALRTTLEQAGFWTAGDPKPHRPKEAVEHALRQARIPRSAALYGRIAGRVSLNNCVDPALAALREAFRAWFGDPA